MTRRWTISLLLLAGLLISSTQAGESTRRKVRLIPVAPAQEAPVDLTRPEGKSRWDLSQSKAAAPFERTLEVRDGKVAIQEALPGGAQSIERVYADPSGGGAAVEWFFPDHDGSLLRMGTVRDFAMEETVQGRITRLTARTEIVGIGWLHLPSRPYEVVLQRCQLQREPAGTEGRSEPVFYRWINNQNGVVAEWHPDAAAAGASRGSASYYLDVTLDGAATLKIYSSQMFSPPLTDVGYGWDAPGTCTTSGTPCSLDSHCASGEDCVKNVSTLTTPSHGTVGSLIAADTWDFSGITTGTETSATFVTVSAAETCNFAQCGYGVPGGVLERLDKNFATPASTVKTNDVVEIEHRPADTTIWVRAGSQKEGLPGALGTGEGRFCYVSSDGVTRTPVPLYRFSHQDAPGEEFYMQAGDSWSSGVFNCEQNIFNNVCGVSQSFDTLYAKSCSGHSGTQNGAVIKGGVVTLPSGHTFNALLLRITAEFCVYLGPFFCSINSPVDDVRTFNYLWQVPHLGTAVRLQSLQAAPDAISFSSLSETDIRFGLFPPRSIMVTGQTQTSVSLSWDPGLDTHRISGYKVYWDTDSGSGTAYAFNSQANPGQASIVGTTATISGLTPGTTYYFTVTALSNFTDPSSLIVTTYESLLYPTQVSGDPAFVYPIEVQGATPPATCIPEAEVITLTLDYGPVWGEIEFCWTPVTDACLTGYRILASYTVASDLDWVSIADVGPAETCWIGTPDQMFYLVVANGTGGTGPWGHYGH